MPYRVPSSTYRFQLHSGFTFEDVSRIAPYLAELGVTDVYSSPVLRARKGSTHGYDVVDASMLNPELGGEAQFLQMQKQLEELHLGFLLDIVPNHMAASPENGWWVSVLENGPHSRFFQYFDIDWAPVSIRGKVVHKVMLPILGKPYGDAVEAGEIKVGYDEQGLHFRYYEWRLPMSPDTYVPILKELIKNVPERKISIELREIVEPSGSADLQPHFLNTSFLKETLRRLWNDEAPFRDALNSALDKINAEPDKLDELLEAQWYRLAYWRIASEKINYRRFFDVADLVGLRVENPEVFEARHKRIFQFAADGHVTGLRIDHIDGLFDPSGHLKKLLARLGSNESGEKSFYVVVEKILAAGEVLPSDFACSGTTGYDYLDTLNALFVDAAGLARLTRFYRSFTGLEDSFDDLTYQRKKQVIQELFSGEMRSLGKKLGELSLADRNARDFTPSDLLAALTEITASMDVYRTYIRSDQVSETDRKYIHSAISEARERAGTAIDERLFTFLERVLLIDPPAYVAAEERDKWRAFVMRWQQFTGRVMAKGVEDTAFYNYNRLISLNEVGSEPGRGDGFDPVAEFHARNERIQRDWPDTMNASSTHDTKRSEDVRARINVLSEIAESWERDVQRWSEMNAPLRKNGAPDQNEDLLLYQTLIGMWPMDDEDTDAVPERLKQYLEKASREAKTHTSWIAPDSAFEEALFTYAAEMLKNDTFRTSMLRTQRRVAFHGALNGLSQLTLKLTSPGVPDFYQGTEIWDLSLVDPDNRRPVDYERRMAMLKKLKAADAKGSLDLTTLLRRWLDGRLKLFATWKGLDLRKRRAELFRRGSYTALQTGSESAVAFLRGEELLVVAPRLTTRLVKPGVMPLGEIWGAAAMEGVPAARWSNIFTGEELETDGGPLNLAKVFTKFPVAILEKSG